MLRTLIDVPKRWIPPWKSRPAVYQQWTHGNSLEMQAPLTTRSTKTDFSTETAYQPHDSKPKTLFDRKSPSWGLDRYLGPRFTGWRFGVLNFAVWASIVFLINLIATIWGSTATHEDKGVFFEGDCERVERLDTGLHLLINVLGTILLAGR
jgi:disulfide bond formation protein DsbB